MIFFWSETEKLLCMHRCMHSMDRSQDSVYKVQSTENKCNPFAMNFPTHDFFFYKQKIKCTASSEVW